MEKKAIIAMSGGVDSSVAAYLMKKDGFDCIGVTMKLFTNDEIGVSREHTCCSLDDVNLISVEEIKEPMRVKAKVRYRQPEQWATVTQTGVDEIRVEFDEPQRAITKGQSVVLYDGDVIVGGGTIKTVGEV